MGERLHGWIAVGKDVGHGCDLLIQYGGHFEVTAFARGGACEKLAGFRQGMDARQCALTGAVGDGRYGIDGFIGTAMPVDPLGAGSGQLHSGGNRRPFLVVDPDTGDPNQPIDHILLVVGTGQRRGPPRSSRPNSASWAAVHRRRGLGEGAKGAAVFGKGDHLPDGGCAQDHGHDPVDAQSDAAVGRGAEFRAFRKKPNFSAPPSVSPEPENALLQTAVVDADAAAAQLFAVDHQVIGPGAQAEQIVAVSGSKSVRSGMVKGWWLEVTPSSTASNRGKSVTHSGT
jgi:hypothetical protein